MKHKIGLFYSLFLFFNIACSTVSIEEQNPHFLVSEKHLQAGIIHQYYITKTPKTQNESIRTDIQYRYYKKNEKGEIIEQRFDPAFLLKEELKYILEEQQVHYLSRKAFWRGDSFPYKIGEKNRIFCFDGSKCESESSRTYLSGHTQHYKKKIQQLVDTLILNKAAKVIHSEVLMTNASPAGEIDSTVFYMEETFLQNFGLWSIHIDDPKYSTEYTLVEQLSPANFEQLAQHGIKRVGHIDFDKTLDRKKSFSLCGDHKDIVDYYNGVDFEAGFPGRKKPLKAYISARLDAKKMQQESGFLTFRFVINCKGKAGRFTTDEIDFNYQKKQFHPETVQHLYEILASVPKWDISIVQDKARDAYTYITFKLNNGTITELLP